MDSSSRIIQFLAGVPQFSAMDAQQLTRLFGLTALKVLAKGEPATVAGGAPSMTFALSYRAGSPSTERDRRRKSSAKERRLRRRLSLPGSPASATLIALRETVLLTLSWADLTAAFRAHPDLLETCFATFSRDRVTSSPPATAAFPPRPVRSRRQRTARCRDEGRICCRLGKLGGRQNSSPGKLWLPCPRRAGHCSLASGAGVGVRGHHCGRRWSRRGLCEGCRRGRRRNRFYRIERQPGFVVSRTIRARPARKRPVPPPYREG